MTQFPAYAESAFAKDHKRFSHVSKYALNDYRHTVEDSIRDILEKDFGFSISYFWTDLRMFFGYAAAVVGLGGALYGHLNGFAQTREIVAASVLAYFALSTLMTVIAMVFEGAKLASATYRDPLGREAPFKVDVTTYVDDATGHNLVVELEASQGARKGVVRTARSFGQYFAESGRLAASEVYEDMAEWITELKSQLSNE
ncbi:hypothetical protein H9P43_000812 [Blastocladiella emersonii ATCC 22665]|nr:hypothetical protein H9P43_000812 [Blastocladiella emersonii ATCC 22665]